MSIHPTLTAQQRENFVKLANYLDRLPSSYKEFDMSMFAVSIDSDNPARSIVVTPAKLRPGCGTVCCALGHGPLAGIEVGDAPDWLSYSENFLSLVFTLETQRSIANDNAWDWCFASDWDVVDNTASGAAARIRWMLNHGVPEDFQDMIDTVIPVCY